MELQPLHPERLPRLKAFHRRQFAAGSYALYVEFFNTGSGNARLKLRYRGPFRVDLPECGLSKTMI